MGIIYKNGIKYGGGDSYIVEDKSLIPVIGTQTSSTGSWTGNIDIPHLYNGLTIAYFLPYAPSGNATLNLTLSDGNTTGPINCYYNTSRLTTHYGKGSNIIMTFWGAGSISVDGTATTDDRWIAQADYNTDETGYYLRRIYPNLKADTNKIFPFTMIMQNADGRWESLVTSSTVNSTKTRNTHGFRLGQVLLMYANATYNADTAVGTYDIWSMHSGLIDHRYSFNTENNATKGTAGYKPVYLVGTINNNDGLFYLDETWWTQTLPTTDDGKVYIYIGDAYDYYRMTFVDTQKFYKYTNGALREISQDTVTVNGHTVNKDVPSDAIFTDTTYSAGTGISLSGTTFSINNSAIAPYEANLQWGGKNFFADYGCIDAAMVSELGANRLMFSKAQGITIEYSRDDGVTWIDYGANDSQKVALFSDGTYPFYIGKADSTNKATANGTKYQLRVTLATGAAQIYTRLHKFIILLATTGSNDCTVTIQGALESSPTNFSDFATNKSIGGWSGYNVINVPPFITYGNTPGSQYGRIRFIFKANGGNTNYSGLNIAKIMGFGGVGWIAPSTMAKTGHLYSFDNLQNAVFPSNVKIHNGKQIGYFTTIPTTNQVIITDGTGGGIRSSGYTIATSVPSNAVFTDRYVNSASFAHDSTNNNVKMTLTRAGSDTNTVTANIPKVSSSTAGVVPKGATVSNQSQSTKFLREDGTWAAPSYTTNTNTWRNIKVNGTEKLGTGTGTGALNFKNGTNTTVTYDSGIKINATDSKVTQTLNNNQGSYYPLLFSKKTIDDDAETTDTVYRSSNVYINPNGCLYTKNLQIGGGNSSGTLTLYGYSGGGSVSGQLTQPFNGSGGTITHSLPLTSGSLLNNTDFNNNRELQIYESLNSTMGQDDISYEVTNIRDKIKYVDIFFTDNNFHKGWSGGLNIISENYGYIRIPYDQISKDPLSDSSRFSLFLFGDESSYYLRKRTYYIYETEASSGVYNLYIAASTNNKDLFVQFYGTPGTGSWSNMTVRAQYSTGIKIYRVKLILDL